MTTFGPELADPQERKPLCRNGFSPDYFRSKCAPSRAPKRKEGIHVTRATSSRHPAGASPVPGDARVPGS